MQKADLNNVKSNLRNESIRVLNKIFSENAYLDKTLDTVLNGSDLSLQDRALLFEIVHGVVRWNIKLDWIISDYYNGSYKNAGIELKNILRTALYQMQYLDKVPDYAAINEAVETTKRRINQKSANLVNAILRNILRDKENIEMKLQTDSLDKYLSIKYSHPEWMVNRWLKQFGEIQTEQFLIRNNQKPEAYIRINSIKTGISEFKSKLISEKIDFDEVEYFDEFLRIRNFNDIFYGKSFSEGKLNIQDLATGFSVKLLDVKPEDRVLDICSAPGGKTSFLAAEMKNEGSITALDLHESRIKILEENLNRLGVKNVKAIAVDTLKFKDENKFDKILADVPCSGTGTIAKKPDIKYLRKKNDFIEMPKLQFRLLEKGASLLKTGGKIVYSTCSVDKEENYRVVEKFLKKYSNFELVNASYKFNSNVVSKEGCVEIFPHIHNIDGAFAAKIKKMK